MTNMKRRAMTNRQRRQFIELALKKSEAEATEQIARLLNERRKVLFNELRRANLRKRLLKAKRDNQPLEKAIAVNWQNWISTFTDRLKALFNPVASNVYDVEKTYWADRDQTLGDLDYNQVVANYEARTGRQIANIAEETRNSVLQEVTDWYNTDAPFPDLLDRLGKYFSPERAESIARTESAYISSQIAKDSMDTLGIRQWNWDLAPPENGFPCQLCIDMANNNPHDIGDEMPPIHPHDRCSISYVITPDVIMRQ